MARKPASAPPARPDGDGAPFCPDCLVRCRRDKRAGDAQLGLVGWKCPRCGDRLAAGRPGPPPRTPDKTTNASPGSAEKIRVMCQRLARGEALFHPEDNRRLDDPPKVDGRLPDEIRDGELPRGVTWERAYGKFRARLWRNGRDVHVGRYDTLEEAIEALKEAREKW